MSIVSLRSNAALSNVASSASNLVYNLVSGVTTATRLNANTLGLSGNNTLSSVTLANGQYLAIDAYSSTNSADKMPVCLNPSGGNVGINTSTPGASLHIEGMAALGMSVSGNMFKYQNNGTAGPYNAAINAGTASCSLYTSGRVIIGSAEVIVYSDSRIKTMLPDKSFDALDTVCRLEPTFYAYKDAFLKGGGVKYGLVAQQVGEVFPPALSLHEGFACNKCLLVEDIDRDAGTLRCKGHGLSAGSRVRLLREHGQSLDTVVTQVQSPDSFCVEAQDLSDVALLYGELINDVHTLDYYQLFCVGLAAIRQLSDKLSDVTTRLADLEHVVRLSRTTLPGEK